MSTYGDDYGIGIHYRYSNNYSCDVILYDYKMYDLLSYYLPANYNTGYLYFFPTLNW